MVIKNTLSDERRQSVEIHVMKGNELYLSMGGVCAKLSISKATGGRWKKEGKLPGAVEINGIPRYRDSDVENMIAEQNLSAEEKPTFKKSTRIKNKG